MVLITQRSPTQKAPPLVRGTDTREYPGAAAEENRESMAGTPKPGKRPQYMLLHIEVQDKIEGHRLTRRYHAAYVQQSSEKD